jgi:septation ring formation regulator EzrA
MKRISLNKVMAKLAVEQKVELNALRDFELGVFDFPSLVSNVEGEIESFARRIQSEINDLEQKSNTLDKAYNELKAKAKELGVEIEVVVTPSSVQMYEQAKKRLKKFQPVIKSLKKV